MGVTDSGLPYPDDSAPVADGALAIKALAEALPGKGSTGQATATTSATGIVLIPHDLGVIPAGGVFVQQSSNSSWIIVPRTAEHTNANLSFTVRTIAGGGVVASTPVNVQWLAFA